MERVLKQVVKVLASNTNYATLITGPTYHHNKVKFIQLSKLNEEQLLAVIVVEGNLVKNQIVNLDETIDDEQILKLNLLLNTQLNGLTIEEISLGMITKLPESLWRLPVSSVFRKERYGSATSHNQLCNHALLRKRKALQTVHRC